MSGTFPRPGSGGLNRTASGATSRSSGRRGAWFPWRRARDESTRAEPPKTNEIASYVGYGLVNNDMFHGPLIRVTISRAGVRFDTPTLLVVGPKTLHTELRWEDIARVVGRRPLLPFVGRGALLPWAFPRRSPFREVEFVRKEEHWSGGGYVFGPRRSEIPRLLADVGRLGPPGLVVDDPSSPRPSRPSETQGLGPLRALAAAAALYVLAAIATFHDERFLLVLVLGLFPARALSMFVAGATDSRSGEHRDVRRVVLALTIAMILYMLAVLVVASRIG